MTRDRAIAILAAGDPERVPFEREFAVAAFAAWLNSPDENMICEWISLVTFNCIMASPHIKNFNLDTAWYLNVCEPGEYIKNLDECLPAYSFVNDDYPNIYDNYRYVSDVVRFLMTYKIESLDKRKSASLRKAYDFLNNRGGFVKGKYPYRRDFFLASLSGHQVVWKRLKESAPFLFVRDQGRAINWRLDPRDQSYVQSLTEIASRFQEIKDFFSKVAWVQQRMKSILDRRSMATGDYFQFSSTVALKEFQLPAMPAGANAAMESYSQADFI